MQNKFEILQMPPENTNSVLVSNGGACVIFDAWGRADDWIKMLDSRGLRPVAIYSTHGHPDHISAAPQLAAHYGVDWYLHAADWNLLGWGGEILDYFGVPRMSGGPKPCDIEIGDAEPLPNLHMRVIGAPGHSAGGVMFYFMNDGLLLTGDTLFANGIGRYDLPGANPVALQKSIADIYNMNFPDNTITIHGHGAPSTIGKLKHENPYFANIKK